MRIRIDIPPRPEVLIKLNAEIRKDAPALSALSAIVAKDVGLAGGILALANSPRFAGGGTFSSIKDAINYLGLDMLMTFATSVEIKKALGGSKPGLIFFWEKSNAVAQLCLDVAKSSFFAKQSIKPSDLYSYGLFQDCGQAILLLNCQSYLEKIGRLKDSSCDILSHHESNHFGIHHSKAGYMLCHYWGLPLYLCSAIKDHHDPEAYIPPCSDEDRKKVLLMAIGHLALVTYLMKLDCYDQEDDRILPMIPSCIGISIEEVNAILGVRSPEDESVVK